MQSLSDCNSVPAVKTIIKSEKLVSTRFCFINLSGNNQRNREFDLDQDMDGIQDDLEHIEESALCPGGRILRLNVSATERVPQ